MIPPSRAPCRSAVPILSRPAIATGPQQRQNFGLVTRQKVKDSGGGRGGRFEQEIVAIEIEFNAEGSSRSHGFGRTHIRALQRTAPAFSDAVEVERFASLPSAPVFVVDPNELERTVGTGSGLLPSASLATVRRPCIAKPFAVLGFGIGVDDADGANDRTLACSVAGLLAAVVMQMIRVLARPSRSKPISMPILQRKVAARRNRPDSAVGLSGQVLDLATRSPATSARAPRRSEAVPVHSVRDPIRLRTPAAI